MQRDKKKRIITNILKITVSVVLILILVFKSNIRQVLSSIAGLSAFAVFCIIAVHFSNVFASAVKWKVLLPGRSLGYLFKIVLEGNFYSTVLPGQLFGEAAKAAKVSTTGEGVQKAVSSVVVDKITGLIALCTLGFVGVIFTKERIPVVFTVGLVIGFALSVLALFAMRIPVLMRLIDRFFAFLARKFPKRSGLFQKIYEIFETWEEYSKQYKTLALSFLLGIIYQGLIVASCVVIAYFLGIGVSFFDWCWIMAVLSVVLLLPVSFAGIGLREGTIVGLLGILGIGNDPALTLSLILFGLHILAAAVGSVFMVLDMRQKKKGGAGGAPLGEGTGKNKS